LALGLSRHPKIWCSRSSRWLSRHQHALNRLHWCSLRICDCLLHSQSGLLSVLKWLRWLMPYCLVWSLRYLRLASLYLLRLLSLFL